MKDVFYKLLMALACFDNLYISIMLISNLNSKFAMDSDLIKYLTPYFLFPFKFISTYGTIFMTVAISIERYIGIHYSCIEKRKSWFYIIPVILISVTLNVPTFFEKQVIQSEEDEDGKKIIKETWTELRREPTYILGKYYSRARYLFSKKNIWCTKMVFPCPFLPPAC